MLEPILSVGNEEENNNTVNLNQLNFHSSKSKFENTTGLMLDDLQCSLKSMHNETKTISEIVEIKVKHNEDTPVAVEGSVSRR